MIQHALTPVAIAWTEAAIPITLFLVIGFVLVAFIKAWQQRKTIERQAALQQQMLDRFSTSEEFVGFLRTPEGQKYLDMYTAAPVSRPVEKLMSGVRTGLIIVFAAIGLIAAGAIEGDIYETLAMGVLALFVGVGFLGSAIVTHRMAKSFGLLERSGNRELTDAS